MDEVIKWFGSRPIHFAVLVVGICVCFGMFVTSCSKVMEAEFKYKTESSKTFWETARDRDIKTGR